MVLSSAIVCYRLRSQAITEVCFHMIVDDRRTICNPQSSAIIIWKPALRCFSAFTKLRFLTCIVSCGSKTMKLVKAMKQAFSLSIIKLWIYKLTSLGTILNYEFIKCTIQDNQNSLYQLFLNPKWNNLGSFASILRNDPQILLYNTAALSHLPFAFSFL